MKIYLQVLWSSASATEVCPLNNSSRPPSVVHLAPIFLPYFLKLVEKVVNMSTSVNLLKSCST